MPTVEQQLNNTRDRSIFFKYYANATGGIDMASEGPGGRMLNAEIHVLGTGNLAVTRVDGTIVTIPSVPAGYVLPASVRSINASGTTATGFVVYW